MSSPLAILPALLVSLTIPASLSALDAQSGSRSRDTSAVDAKGLRHYREDYPGHHPPWQDDMIQAFGPRYPYSDRAQHHDGVGLFCLTLDLKTGSVSKVTILKSIGFATLDSSAVATLLHWRWKPGKWKEINVPITFQIRSRPPPLKPGQTPLPHLR